MKAVSIMSAGLALLATGAIAQATEQGPSGNPQYPVQVVAEDGTLFFCKAENELRNGTPVRACIRPARGATGDPFTAGGPGIAIAAGAVGLGVIALVVADDTTN